MFKLCLATLVLMIVFIQNAVAEIPYQENNLPPSQAKLITSTLFKDANLAIAAYRNGLEQIMNVIPDDISDRNHDLFPLSFIKREISPIIGWGHIQEDAQMMALSSGNKKGCWIMFYDTAHPSLKMPSATLFTARVDGIVTIVARPDRISEKWAGIFLIHELSHAYDELLGVSRSPGFNELIAYDLERRAYNLLSKNKFTLILDEIIHSENIQSVAELATDIKNDSKRFGLIINNIEKEFNEEPELSISERQMRDGFFVTSLAIRIGEIQNLDAKVMAQNIENLLNQISIYKQQ